jgi:NADPH:quinone reductase-like Zn-dependent oxidoreductase
MHAVVRDRYGPPGILVLRDVERPPVGADEVLVRIVASSLNQGDLDYLYGRPFLTRLGIGLRGPRHPGMGFDAAGQVEAVGPAVTRFRPGDAVFGDLTQHGHGAFAEYACAPERAWAPKPAGLTFEEAATLPQAAILALQGLRGRRRIGPGDRVLVNGASGSVGPFAVQIAKAWGAHVTGVCSTPKLAFVRALGADEVIDYTRGDYTRSGQRYDRILDVAGNQGILACRRALTSDGVYVMVGGSTRRICGCLLLGPVVSLAERRRMGFLWWKPFRQTDVATLTGLIDSRGVRPVIDRRYPLADVAEALRYLESGRAQGKVVITM